MSSSAGDVLIVGAGLAGLTAARRLTAAGLKVTVIEKGTEVGGRLATQAIGVGRADAGAQFFTARSAAFQEIVGRWLADGLVFEWSCGWSDGSLVGAPPDGYPRYAAREGFRALADHLAQGLDARTSAGLNAVALDGDTWLASGEEIYRGRSLILTPPVPQSLALLVAGGVVLPPDDQAILASIDYAPCLCGLFEIKGPIDLPDPGVLQRPDEAIVWIADNHRKGISSGGRTITVHSGGQASREHWSMPDEAVLNWMLEEIGPRLSADARIRASQLIRWPYAAPLTTYPARCLVSHLSAPLIFAGDAFDGPRVEGAVLSGWAAAGVLLAELRPR